MNLQKLKEHLNSKPYLELVKERYYFLERIKRDIPYRAQMYYLFKKDIFAWIKYCVYLYEPRSLEEPEIIFLPFPYQIEIIKRLEDALKNKKPLFIEKSRDMGVTWTICVWLTHKWLFTENFSALIGSRKEAEVDNKTTSSIFGKIRFILAHQPTFLLPEGFKRKLHDNQGKLINPENGSILLGESANENFGRGNRTTVVYCDELWFWPFVQQSLRAVQDTSPVQIYVSTPVEDAFAKRFVDNLRKQGSVISLHWSQHPFKDKTWYEKEVEKRRENPLSILSELELSYDIDPLIRYYPEAYNCKTEPISFNPSLPLMVGLDFGWSKSFSAIVWAQYDIAQEKTYVLTSLLSRGFRPPGKDLMDWFLPFLDPSVEFDEKWYNYNELEVLNKVRRWRKPDYFYGEPAHNQGTAMGTSVVGWFFERNINIETYGKGIFYKERKSATLEILKNCVFNSEDENALLVLDALKSAKRSPNVVKGSIDKERMEKPIHVEGESDLRAAFENLAVGIINLYRDSNHLFRPVNYVKNNEDKSKIFGEYYLGY